MSSLFPLRLVISDTRNALTRFLSPYSAYRVRPRPRVHVFPFFFWGFYSRIAPRFCDLEDFNFSETIVRRFFAPARRPTGSDDSRTYFRRTSGSAYYRVSETSTSSFLSSLPQSLLLGRSLPASASHICLSSTWARVHPVLHLLPLRRGFP